MISRTIKYKSKSVLRSLYKSLVRAHLEYCTPVEKGEGKGREGKRRGGEGEGRGGEGREVEIWHTCRYLCVLASGIKILPLGGVELPLFIWGPPYISETNRARKFKFGMLAGICR